jgi:hypothetical protein
VCDEQYSKPVYMNMRNDFSNHQLNAELYRNVIFHAFVKGVAKLLVRHYRYKNLIVRVIILGLAKLL